MKIKFNIVSNQFKCYKNEICQHLELSKNQSNVIKAMPVFHDKKTTCFYVLVLTGEGGNSCSERAKCMCFPQAEFNIKVDHIV